MLIIIILILINKGLFEPIYKDLKFMVQNRSYICTSLITNFSYLGHGVSLHGCSSKAQPLLLTLDEGYLLTATPPDLECGIAPLGPLHQRSHRSLDWGCSSQPLPLTSDMG